VCVCVGGSRDLIVDSANDDEWDEEWSDTEEFDTVSHPSLHHSHKHLNY